MILARTVSFKTLSSLATCALAASLALAAPAHANPQRIPASKEEVLLSYAPLVKQVTPAVVNVYASRVVRETVQRLPFNDPFFREFFGNDFSAFGAPRERMQRSLGSGVIVDKTGLIVTNHHVIDGMTDVKIALSDKREFEVDVLLRDPRADLAVLQIKDQTRPFPAVALDTSDGTEVGDLVLAIGNPYGLGQTVTSGIVSAIRRVSLSAGEQRVFLQTDAAINQGNSGGALVNMSGNLVGINTAIFSRSGGSDGIGFAIPSSIVRYVIAAAQAGEKQVRRPWLGAQLQTITPDIAANFQLETPTGALVADIAPQSPADRAGLEVGDIVVAVNGQPTEDPAGVLHLFTTRPIGSQASFSVLRNAKQRTVNVAVQPAPETTPPDMRPLKGNGPLNGATVANLSPALLEEIGIEGAASGVVIVNITSNSLAARLGFQVKDRILSINDQNVTSSKSTEQLNAQASRSWKITIERGGRTMTQAFRF